MNTRLPELALEKVLVIIPALNEEATIASAIAQLQQQGLSNICVVDNGSCDRTETIAIQSGAEVVFEPQKGYGQACWTGLQTSAARQAEWILFCDGDGSDDLSELGELLSLRDRYDFILGNRRGTVGGRSHLTTTQNFGNWLATRLIYYGWGYAYHDLGPLRLIRRSSLDRLNMRDRNFGWTVEMQAKAVACGLRICERPVHYRPRQGGQSKISGTLGGSFQAGRIILSTLAYWYWNKTGAVLLAQIRTIVQSAAIQRILLRASALLLIVGSLQAMPFGDFLNQVNAVPNFWKGIGLMGAGFVASWGLKQVSGYWFWGVAIATRLILLAMYPGDDIWRYLWEGHIQSAGFNPYLLAPSADVLTPLRFAGWEQINHMDHAAIYPPLTQLGFRLLSAIQPSVLLFKLSFAIADLAICWLLSRRFGYSATLLYAWNPLVIYSFAGGGHYDSWFLLMLVAGWLWGERWILSALAIGASIAIKWMSLPILLFVAWKQYRKDRSAKLSQLVLPNALSKCGLFSLALLGLGLLPIAVSALPFCKGFSCPILPLTSSFVSYGRSAAFIPHFVEQLWPAAVKSNLVFAIPLGLLVLWNLVRTNQTGKFAERYLMALMLLSPIIHAWYFTWLVPFAVFTRSWATRLASLSAFVYFALPHSLAVGTLGWTLEGTEYWALWGPFVLGLVVDALTKEHEAATLS